MATQNNSFSAPDTYGGQAAKWYHPFVSSPDIKYGELRTRNAPQEAAQLGTLGSTLANLWGGWSAPNIERERQAEYRNLHQNVLPQLGQNYGAGLGGKGPFEQNLANAYANSADKMAALQNERQFQLQKLRQEQLPRLLETGLSSSFTPHLYEGEFNPNARPTETVANRLEKSKTGQAVGRVAEAFDPSLAAGVENIGEAGLRGIQGIKKVGQGVNAFAGEKAQATLNAIEKKYPHLKPQLDKLRKAGVNFEKNTRHPNIPLLREKPKTAETQKEYEANREAAQLAEKAKLPETVSKLLQAKHTPMLKDLLGRRRAKKELARIESPEELEQLWEFWEKHPSKRSKIKNFFRGLFGKRKKSKKE